FGVPIQNAVELYAQAANCPWLDVAGVSVHIGSQILSVEPFFAAMQRVAELIRELGHAGHRIRYVDAGGGLGISYSAEKQFDFAERCREYAEAVRKGLEGLKVDVL